jgi:hypothetical protein
MLIPEAKQLASMVAMPALAGVSAGASSSAQGTADWLKGSLNNAALKPLTIESMPIGRRSKPAAPATPLDNWDDSKPYLMAIPEKGEPGRRSTSHAAGLITRTWKRQIRSLEGVFRWINQGAYFISVPFIVLFLLGAVIKNRNVAIFAGTFVVLLSIGRTIAGAANLALVPLRDGLNTKKMKNPFRRLIEPIVTIGIVVLAFTFLPWLSTPGASKGTITQRLEAGVKSLGTEMKGELGNVVDKAKTVDLDRLGKEAQNKLKTLGTGEGGAGTTGNKGPSPEEKVQGLMNDVKQRTNATLEELQK